MNAKRLHLLSLIPIGLVVHWTALIFADDNQAKDPPLVYEFQKSVVTKNNIEVRFEWPENKVFYAGDRIYAKLTITNRRTKGSVDMLTTPAEEVMRLDCVRPEATVPLTQFGERVYAFNQNHRIRGSSGTEIRTGKARVWEIDVSRCYDLSVPGVYNITQNLTLSAVDLDEKEAEKLLNVMLEKLSPEELEKLSIFQGPKQVGLKLNLKERP